VNLDYLLMFLQSEHGRALMQINSPGAAGRNRTIRLGQFLDEEMPLPPLAEQIEIVGTFRIEERRIAVLLVEVSEAIDRLKEFRTALISAAVTGKIDVLAAAEAFVDWGGAA
jgi:type I restriction enzyme S subunit